MLKNKLSPHTLIPAVAVTSANNLPAQVLAGWQAGLALQLTGKISTYQHIVISGMGGSNLAGRLVVASLADQLKIPLLINCDYQIPAFVGRQTLFIAVSYSGNTEETLQATVAANKSGAKIIILTTASVGNRLLAWGRKLNLACLVLNADLNPSQQPRLAVGYGFGAVLGLLRQLKIIKVTDKDIQAAVKFVTKQLAIWQPTQTENDAVKIAEQLHGTVPFLIGSEFLAGNLHTLRNQLCENSKNLADYLIVSEMNHYALEGLAQPPSNRRNLSLLFFDSSLNSSRIQKRLTLTKKAATKNGLTVLAQTLRGTNHLTQAVELLTFGTWLTLYLAQINLVDPLTIPWVDWFKRQLADQ